MICEGKVAIVTGAAGRGIGRSIALTLAREGASVIVNYLTSEDEASAIVDYIVNRGGKAAAHRADIRDRGQCRDMYDAAAEKFGKVDICIVGPGAGWHTETIDKLNPAAAAEDIDKETVPLYNLMPLVFPGMYERKWGRFIGISMNLSTRSPSFAYDAAKAARTHVLHRACGEAWEHGVTVNIIAPGPVKDAGSLEKAIALCERWSEWEKRGNVTPQDIAEGVTMLCSESGRFITGCELTYMYY